MSVFNLYLIPTESETIKASSHEKISVRYTHKRRRSNELLNDSQKKVTTLIMLEIKIKLYCVDY